MKLRQPLAMRLDLTGLIPSKLAGLTAADVDRLALNTEFGPAKVGDMFSVSGSAGETLTIEGSSDRLDFIGAGLDLGTVVVEGDAGAYAGSRHDARQARDPRRCRRLSRGRGQGRPHHRQRLGR